MIRKVTAFITRDVDDRRELLVFAHRHQPEAGIQVPAGTVEPGEDFAAAVLREVWEESGLLDFASTNDLGDLHDQAEDGRPRWRRFYHLTVTPPVPDVWSHAADGCIFEYRWVDCAGDTGLHPKFMIGWLRFRDQIMTPPESLKG